MIVRLENTIRNYAWGSLDGLAQFMGRSENASKPEAEMWIGAHPDDSSRVVVGDEQVPLVTLIADYPSALLGFEVTERFGSVLPFLMKVLAAGSPLSLQAHPTLEQAIAGFDDEERRGIPRNAPNRNYRDRNHKPELIYAFTPFEALCGFRPISEIVATFERLNQPKLLELSKQLRAQPNAKGLKALLEELLVSVPGQHDELIRQTLEAAERGQHTSGPDKQHLSWIANLGRVYPGDVGVVTALLLNYVALEVGQAIFLPARSLHSYLSGVGIEIMASSDNVLRGGLTPKHVDAAELLKVLCFEPMIPPIATTTLLSTEEQAFLTPAADFRLSRITLDGRYPLAPIGPELLLCAEGNVSLMAKDEAAIHLDRGESAFIAAVSQGVTLEGHGTLFRATVGTF
jgi:mannose-6-phosphate isomerase